MITDNELFNLVLGKGIQFLDLSYDVVPVKDGYALRVVGPQGQLHLFDTYQTDVDLIAGLRDELETQMWQAITGRHLTDINWTKGG